MNEFKKPMSPNKDTLIDQKLDQILQHQRKIDSLKADLSRMVTDISDSENKDEQRNARAILENSANNPIFKEIMKEESEINKINSELKEMTS